MKETFYFSHDYNASQDPKMMTLLSSCGLNGVGMYWILIELLHQQPDSKLSQQNYENYIDFYGRMDGENEHLLNKIKQVLISSELLTKDGDYVFSNRVLQNKKEREIKSEKAKQSAEKRWGNANAMPTQSEPNAIKERKGKEIKEKESSKEQSRFTPPTLIEVSEYITRMKYGLDPQEFMDANEARGWMIGKAKMKDWQAVVRTFERNRLKWSTDKPKEISERRII
jgi:hypothetical protein